MTAVVCALPEEAAPLAARMDGAGRSGGCPDGLEALHRGALGRRELVLAVTGDGGRRAQRGIRALLAAHPVDRLLVLGVSGGLSPALPSEAVVVARTVQLDGGPAHRASDAAVRAALSVAGVAPATALTTGSLVTDGPAKVALRARAPEADVVDLESAHYVAAAEAAGVSWLVVRAVSDAADEALPAFLERCLDGDGAVDRGAVARHAATHPWVVPRLLSLRERVRRCAVRLADAAERVLAAWPAS